MTVKLTDSLISENYVLTWSSYTWSRNGYHASLRRNLIFWTYAEKRTTWEHVVRPFEDLGWLTYGIRYTFGLYIMKKKWHFKNLIVVAKVQFKKHSFFIVHGNIRQYKPLTRSIDRFFSSLLWSRIVPMISKYRYVVNEDVDTETYLPLCDQIEKHH